MAGCARSTLSYDGGEINLAAYAVYAYDPEHGRAVRIRAAVDLKVFGSRELPIVAVPRGVPADPRLVVDRDAPLPAGGLRGLTSAARAAGQGHRCPLSEARKSQLRTAWQVFTHDADPKRIGALFALCETRGVDTVLDALAVLAPATNHPGYLLDQLDDLVPTLAERAAERSANSESIDALGASAGAPVTRLLYVDAERIDDHALLRFFARVDGLLDGTDLDEALAAVESGDLGTLEMVRDDLTASIRARLTPEVLASARRRFADALMNPTRRRVFADERNATASNYNSAHITCMVPTVRDGRTVEVAVTVVVAPQGERAVKLGGRPGRAAIVKPVTVYRKSSLLLGAPGALRHRSDYDTFADDLRRHVSAGQLRDAEALIEAAFKVAVRTTAVPAAAAR
jgi:hypothetical protein